MFLRRLLVISLTLAFGATTFGQQPQTSTQEGALRVEEMRHREGRHRKRISGGDRHRFDFFRNLRAMRELNLTDEQQQQQRAILERHVEGIKAKRDELFKLREKKAEGNFTADDGARARELRQDIHSSMLRAYAEIESVLTPEQRMKLEQIKTEQKARHDEVRQQR